VNKRLDLTKNKTNKLKVATVGADLGPGLQFSRIPGMLNLNKVLRSSDNITI